MLIPVLGMFIGLLIAVFFSYRKPREYTDLNVTSSQNTISKSVKSDENGKPLVAKFTLIMAAIAVVMTLFVQVISDSMILAGLVANGVDPYLDAEALRVIKAMPKWKPGKQRGKEVNVKYTLPIHFRLQ